MRLVLPILLVAACSRPPLEPVHDALGRFPVTRGWLRVDGDEGRSEWRTLARFTFRSEPTVLEARRRPAGPGVAELRVRDQGSWRVVSRIVDEPIVRDTLD